MFDVCDASMEPRLLAIETAVANLSWQMNHVMACIEGQSEQAGTTKFAVVAAAAPAPAPAAEAEAQADAEADPEAQTEAEAEAAAPAATAAPAAATATAAALTIGLDVESDTDKRFDREVSELSHVEYKVEESIWSLILFVGEMKHLGTGGETVLVLLFFIQIVFLLILVIVVKSNFTENEYATWLDDFNHWRTHFAHFHEFYDRISNKSLATSVCEDSKSMAFYSFHGGFIHDLNEYKYNSEFFGGPTMCCTALCLWLISVIRELTRTFDALTFFLSLPRAKNTKVVHHGDNSWSLEHISSLKLAVVWLVCVVRVAVACCLGYWGSCWLVYTISLPDLLLNAVALQFVLDLDQFLYAALGPQSVKNLVSSMRPLRTRMLMYKGVDYRTICSLFLLLLLSVLVVGGLLLPFQEDLHDLELAACGGTRNFIFHTTPGGVLVSYETFEDKKVLNPTGDAFKSAGDDDESEQGVIVSLLKQVILDRTKLPEVTVLAVDYSTTKFSFTDWSSATIEKVSVYSNPHCKDLPWDHQRTSLVSPIQRRYGFNMSRCADIQKSACYLDTPFGQTVRMICPGFCQCRNPRFAMSKASFGCPSSCAARQKAMWETLPVANRPCRDISVATHAYWAEYLDSISNVSGKWKLQAYWPELTDVVMACGLCSSRSALLQYGVDPCSDGDDWPFTSIAFICPVSCGCPSSRVCPISCMGEAASGIAQTNSEQWQAITEARRMAGEDPLNVTGYYEFHGTSLNQCMTKAVRTHGGKCGSLCAEGSILVPENISYISKYGTTYFCSDAERFLRDSALSWECQRRHSLGKNCCVAVSWSSRIDVATLPAVLFLCWARIVARNQAWRW